VRGEVIKPECEKIIKMISATIEFNNAGARCLEAGKAHLVKVAWDLFKGSLEVYKQFCRSPSTKTEVEPSRFEIIQRAELHLLNIEDIIAPSSDSGSPLETSREASVASLKIGGMFHPYLLRAPFLIDETNIIGGIPQSARRIGASIIFNLGLVEQLRSPSSKQVIALYQLATELVGGTESGRLGIALINNIAVWCFANDDLNASQRCLEHLCRMLERGSGFFDKAELSGLVSNIKFLLIPRFFASPAA